MGIDMEVMQTGGTPNSRSVCCSAADPAELPDGFQRGIQPSRFSVDPAAQDISSLIRRLRSGHKRAGNNGPAVFQQVVVGFDRPAWRRLQSHIEAVNVLI